VAVPSITGFVTFIATILTVDTPENCPQMSTAENDLETEKRKSD